jgi:miniconductance mechanosensitive channel
VYEALQADIFDHLLAVIPELGLRVFQSPGGTDLHAAVSGVLTGAPAQERERGST